MLCHHCYLLPALSPKSYAYFGVDYVRRWLDELKEWVHTLVQLVELSCSTFLFNDSNANYFDIKWLSIHVCWLLSWLLPLLDYSLLVFLLCMLVGYALSGMLWLVWFYILHGLKFEAAVWECLCHSFFYLSFPFLSSSGTQNFLLQPVRYLSFLFL